MVLDQLNDGAQRLLFVVSLPLIDGVFATLLVAGAVQTFSDIIAIALTIFAGAGALAVLYSYSESRKEARKMVLQIAPIVIAGAIMVGLVAPVFDEIFVVERLKYAAALALIVIAGQMYGFDLSDHFAVPGIILTGMVLSIDSLGAISLSTEFIIPAFYTSVIAVVVLYLAAYLDSERLHLGCIRKGGAVVLVIISMSLAGFNVPSELGLIVFMTSFFAALVPRTSTFQKVKVLVST